MNRIFLLLFLGLLSAASVFGRETVKGMVVNSKGEPIPGVKVEIPGSSEFTFTDFDGAFQILLRDPVKNLSFSYPGFGTISRRVMPEMRVVLGKGWDGHPKGFRGMFDLEGGIGVKGKATFISGTNEARDIHTFVLPGISFTFGYQFNSHLFIGAGYGIYLDATQYEEIDKYYDSSYCYNETEVTGGYFPVFVAARWDFGLAKKTAPYIGLRVGFAQYVTDPDNDICWIESYDTNMWSRLEVYQKPYGSLFFSPTVGYRMSLHNKSGMNLGISYMAGLRKKYSATSYFGHDSSSTLEIRQRNSDIIMFNIGFDF